MGGGSETEDRIHVPGLRSPSAALATRAPLGPRFACALSARSVTVWNTHLPTRVRTI
jgi:hypothetical protein